MRLFYIFLFQEERSSESDVWFYTHSASQFSLAVWKCLGCVVWLVASFLDSAVLYFLLGTQGWREGYARLLSGIRASKRHSPVNTHAVVLHTGSGLGWDKQGTNNTEGLACFPCCSSAGSTAPQSERLLNCCIPGTSLVSPLSQPCLAAW